MSAARTALVGAVATLAFALLLARSNANRTGSDTAAVDVAGELKPGYRPWMMLVGFTPAPAQEKLLFALQASAGAACFAFAVSRRRRQGPRN